MTWGEANRLVGILSRDPSSQFGAAYNNFTQAVDPTHMLLADLWDVTLLVAPHKGKTPTYPRWWVQAAKKTGPDSDITQEMIVAALRRAGHTAEIPYARGGEHG